MKKTLRKAIQVVVFFSIGFGLLYFVYQKQLSGYQEYCEIAGIPASECSLVDKVVRDYVNADFFWIGMVVVAFMISNISRALRWKMLIKPLGVTPRTVTLFFSIMLMFFTNLFFPRIGEVIRAGTVSKYEGVPVEKIMGTVVLDRLMDVICFGLLILVTLAVEFDALYTFIEQNASLDAIRGRAALLVILGLVFLGTFIMAIVYRRRLLKYPFFQKIARLLMGFKDGILTILKLDRPGIFIFHSVVIWIMFFAMTYLGFKAYGPTELLDIGAGLITFVSGALSFIIPSPGGLGTYHALVPAALSLYEVPGPDAFSFANIMFFTITIGCNMVLGLAALVVLPLINQRKHVSVESKTS